MTVKEYYDLHNREHLDDNRAIIENDSNGQPYLWIEKHGDSLTVVDCNSSAKELSYRDESNLTVDEVKKELSMLFEP